MQNDYENQILDLKKERDVERDKNKKVENEYATLRVSMKTREADLDKAKKRKSSGHGSTKKPRKSGNGEIGLIKCSECPKKFSDEQARLKHVMVHRRASIKLSRFSSRSGH